MKRKNTISINIMTFNEERCIDRCIKSVYLLADEIIIIDTGSTDKTLDILNSYNSPKIKIYQRKWTNSFSKIRNEMIKLSTKDIIIQIDADEYVSPKLDHFEIKKILSENLNEYTCFYPKMIDFYGNKYSGAPVRIFLNNKSFFYFGDIHEEVRNSEFHIEKKEIDIVFFHDGYLENIVQKKEKGKRNLKLSKRMLKKEPENPRWFYHYIKDLFYYEKNNKIIFKIIQDFFKLVKDTKTSKNMIEEVQLIQEILFINTRENYTPDFKYLSKKYPHNIDIIFLNLLLIRKKLIRTEEAIFENLRKYNELNDFYSFFNQNGDHILYFFCDFFDKFNQFEIFENLFEDFDFEMKKEYYKQNIKKRLDIYNNLYIKFNLGDDDNE